MGSTRRKRESSSRASSRTSGRVRFRNDNDLRIGEGRATPGYTRRNHQNSTSRLIPTSREREKNSLSDLSIVPESYSSSNPRTLELENSSSYSLPFFPTSVTVSV